MATQWYRSFSEDEAIALFAKANVSIQTVRVLTYGVAVAEVVMRGDAEAAIARLYQVGVHLDECRLDKQQTGKMKFRVYADTPIGGKHPRSVA